MHLTKPVIGMRSEEVKTTSMQRRVLAVVALFSVLQFILHVSFGPWLTFPFLPAPTLFFIGFPCALLASVTYLETKKAGAVGATLLIGGIMAFMIVGFFPPVAFQFIIAAIATELVTGAYAILHRQMGVGGAFALGGMTVLGRYAGWLAGMLLFLPESLLRFVLPSLQSYTYLYLFLPAPVLFIIGGLGGSAAVPIVRRLHRGGGE